jgi:putative ABC transport system permease protein
MNAAVWRALISGPLYAAPGRTLLAVAAIAIGVALGLAVHLINASAASEFERAARQLAGEADLLVRGGRAGFDEQLYPQITKLPEVSAASPVIELEATFHGLRDTLKIIGIDALRAYELQPQLAGWDGSAGNGLFDAGAIRLSASAAKELSVDAGDTVTLKVGTQSIDLRVTGIIPDSVYRQRLGIMDIAAVQWHLNRIGIISRIDLRLQAGTDLQTFQRRLQSLLPPGVHAVTPDIDSERGLALTRAYRLNLDMLALIALFTGTFMVFSSQVLALLRRRTQIALLRALGVTRGEVLTWLIAEGALIGCIGGIIGLLGGYVLAGQAMAFVGADLGADYFRNLNAGLAADSLTLAAFLGLGITFSVIGAALPAWDAARRQPASALHAGDDSDELHRPLMITSGLAALLTGAALALLPPIGGLPVAGYAAIAMLLVGAVLLMPALAGLLLSPAPLPANTPLALGLAQLKATTRHVAISVAAILVSFSLVVSMLIMVLSFRQSLDNWLDQVLPADLYMRAAQSAETAVFSPLEQKRIADTTGVASVTFSRYQSLLIQGNQPPVTVIARDMSSAEMPSALPLVSPPAILPEAAPPAAWISEISAALFTWKTGQIITLPLGNAAQTFIVAGVWRDYSRQNGAVIIDRNVYRKITGDGTANDAAIRLADPEAALSKTEQALRAAVDNHSKVEIASASNIRQISMGIFDRTFAITWALELAALVVGLFGVSIAFSVQALARRREFGVLRHLGMTRSQISAMLAGEGALTAGVGAICGLAVGTLMGLVLIHVINRQSFHWSMELHMPWVPLLVLFIVTVASAAATAVLSARSVMRIEVVSTVREDW